MKDDDVITFTETLGEAGGTVCSITGCREDPAFTARLRSNSIRKARLACCEHLEEVIWNMQRDYGEYKGEYLVTADEAPDDW